VIAIYVPVTGMGIIDRLNTWPRIATAHYKWPYYNPWRANPNDPVRCAPSAPVATSPSVGRGLVIDTC